jgi:pyruvate,water dikinase
LKQPQEDPTAEAPETDDEEHKPVCRGGRTICRGTATGKIFVLTSLDQVGEIPENAIVAAPFGLPQYVTAIHKMAGIILQTGSTAGHFASVAREFGVPAMVCSQGFDTLETGVMVTLDADRGRVYEGKVRLSNARASDADDRFSQSLFMDKLRFAIKFCADLRLTDPASEEFTPEHCRSLHDIIRFVHETAVREMFFLGRRKGSRKKGARQFISGLPMLFYVLDVGGADEAGVGPVPEPEDTVTMETLACVPMKALLKGLAHPDICWDEATSF